MVGLGFSRHPAILRASDAVGCHLPPDNGHLTPDNGHLTPDNGHLTPENCHLTPEN
jgi:hypothetical protein